MTATDLTGQTAIITGASRGIGLATAQALAKAGAAVVLTSRSQESADTAAAQIVGRAFGVGAHVADEDAACRCVELTLDKFGSIDILINNVGTNPAFGPLIEQDHARFIKTFEVNLWAPIKWISLVTACWMSEHGGAIVNTASVGGLTVEPNIGLYNASKAALIHITKQLALELSPRIRVNAIAPGVVRTKLSEALWKNSEDVMSAATPLDRLGVPDDVSEAIKFLVSDAASWITGEVITIDGGRRFGDPTLFRSEGGCMPPTRNC